MKFLSYVSYDTPTLPVCEIVEILDRCEYKDGNSTWVVDTNMSIN